VLKGATPLFLTAPIPNEKEKAMKTKTFVVAGVALFALGVGPATSGPCTTEIDALAKSLSAKDAGAGPTVGALGQSPSAGVPANQHPPTATMSQATQGQATSPEDVRRQTMGQPPAAQQGTPAQHPPTAAMGEATQGQTAPATTGQHPPTAAMSEATQSQAPPRPAGDANTSEASITLSHARTLDQQGKESECMEAVGRAKQLAGSR
jgi:hypothetical protein